jgi:aromatic ring-opening dioxygenase catalytic subunit (LigB family)
MATIALGLATPHSPQVSTPAEEWALHVARDHANTMIDLPSLEKVAPPGLAAELSMDVWRAKYARCERAIDRLGDILAEAAPDAVIVIGDDQHEMFQQDGQPTFAIFHGKTIDDIVPDPLEVDPSIRASWWARHAEEDEAYPCDAELGRHLAKHLCAANFDVTTFTRQPAQRGIGHAFSFIKRRLMRDRIVPMVPIFVNCFFPPNQPSAARCYAFGRALGDAIAAMPSAKRVAIVASGGLTHFVIDETFDRAFLHAIETGDDAYLASVPQELLVAGTSENRNWIVAAAALHGKKAAVLDYVPAYRTTAATGCGMAFVHWS